MGEQQQIDIIDQNIDRILRAAGSGLRYYMPSTKDKLRKVMGEIEAEHRSNIDTLVQALDKIAKRANDPSAGEADLLTKISDMHRFARYASMDYRAALLLARGSAGNE